MKQLLLIILVFCSFAIKAQTAVPVTNQVTLSLENAKDQDGKIVSYSWKQVSGATTTIPNPTSVSTVITFAAAGTYVYEGSVVDNDGLIGKGTHTVVVLPAKQLYAPQAIITATGQTSPGNSTIQLPSVVAQ